MIHRRFDEELEDLKHRLIDMGAMVETQIAGALQALVERNSDLAQRIITNDPRINAMDIAIEEMALRLLALHQPTARDLRFVTTAMKISTELERMSDLAENVCERVIELNEEAQLTPYIDVARMAKRSLQMVKESLDAFVHRDSDLARKVCADDNCLDQLTEQLFREVLSFMIEHPKTISRGIRFTFIAKYLERIGDHATNVAELVVYMVEGKIIRHA